LNYCFELNAGGRHILKLKVFFWGVPFALLFLLFFLKYIFNGAIIVGRKGESRVLWTRI